jgi:hypothetical protein
MRRAGRAEIVRGPDFEIPTDPPPPPPDQPVPDLPGRLRPRRARAAAVVALVGVSAAGAFAWYSQTGTTVPGPAVVSTTTPTRATATTLPTRNSSPSTVTPTTQARAVVRTCLEPQENPRASQGSSPDLAPWITFDFSPRIAADALTLISDAASEARAVLGETPPFTVHIHCDMNEYAASTSTPVEEARLEVERGKVAHVKQGEMWIYGPAFGTKPLSIRREIVYHEYVHILQGFLSGERSGRRDVDTPLWLLEGSARYLENTVRQGDLDTERRTQIRRWGALPTLEELEDSGGSAATGGSGEAYTLGFVASDYLVDRYGRSRLQRDFWVALGETDWRSAFLHVFGLTVDAFYTEFEAYRATLRP